MKRLPYFSLLCILLIFNNLGATPTQPSGCLEGNCHDGYGKYAYANGNRYVGEFANGKPHGRGILYCANGNKYLGEWDMNQRQGTGKFVFAEGHEYVGGFQRNNFHGDGNMAYNNGDRYEGQWLNNLPNGSGTYVFKKGGRYDGGFLDGRFHGQGTLRYANGAVFSGQWQRSKKHGRGVFTDENGQRHEGEWANGKSLSRQVAEPEEGETILVQPIENEPIAKETAIAPPAAEKSSVRIWATVVGVATYNHMPSLRYTDDDAYQMFAFLKSPEGGALPDEQITVLVDDNATRSNILKAMRATFLRADENDVVLFYFSGHGIEGAFIPADFDGFDNRLYHHEIREILDGSKAKHKLVMGDACHAGSLYGATTDNQLLAAKNMTNMLHQYYSAFENSTGGLALLMSSKGEEVSLEDSGLRSGIFSHFLIRGLKGDADFDQDRIVTIKEVFDFTKNNVAAYTVNAQTPTLTGLFDPAMPVSVVRP